MDFHLLSVDPLAKGKSERLSKLLLDPRAPSKAAALLVKLLRRELSGADDCAVSAESILG